MSQHRANGPFEVKLVPQTIEGKFADKVLGHMTIDKVFHGDLEATSLGQMLSAGTEVKGSAGYVAIEKVTGQLGGKNGSFILQHSATMNRGTPELKIHVVPDSGTEELIGLTGTMNILIENGKHAYDFTYSFTK